MKRFGLAFVAAVLAGWGLMAGAEWAQWRFGYAERCVLNVRSWRGSTHTWPFRECICEETGRGQCTIWPGVTWDISYIAETETDHPNLVVSLGTNLEPANAEAECSPWERKHGAMTPCSMPDEDGLGVSMGLARTICADGFVVHSHEDPDALCIREAQK